MNDEIIFIDPDRMLANSGFMLAHPAMYTQAFVDDNSSVVSPC